MKPIMNVTTIIFIFMAKNKATAWRPPNPVKYSLRFIKLFACEVL